MPERDRSQHLASRAQNGPVAYHWLALSACILANRHALEDESVRADLRLRAENDAAAVSEVESRAYLCPGV